MAKTDELESAVGLTGRYRLVALIGSGGMGEVYRATQLSLDRPVAVKVMRRLEGWSAGLEERFLAEARLAAKVSHPNVVKVIDSGRGASGLFIAYELVEGKSLRVRMAGTPLETAVRWMAQAARGLHAIHLAGIVHRDVKPENMLVTKDGTLRLTDLGIAKDLTRGAATAADVMLGTPDYMSPEQILGRPILPQADIYSLGIVLYELVTGSPPFRGRSVSEILACHVTEAPQLPADWDELLGRCLCKDPGGRFASADELARQLEALEVTGKPAVAAVRKAGATRVVGTRSRPAQPTAIARRPRARYAVPLALLGVLAVVAGLALRSQAPPPSPLTPKPSALVQRRLALRPRLAAGPRDFAAILEQIRRDVASESQLAASPLRDWAVDPARKRRQTFDLLVQDPFTLVAPALRVRKSKVVAASAAESWELVVESGAGERFGERHRARFELAEKGVVLPVPPQSLGVGWNAISLEPVEPDAVERASLDVTLVTSRSAAAPPAPAEPLRDCGEHARPMQELRTDLRSGEFAKLYAKVRRAALEAPRCAAAWRAWGDILYGVVENRCLLGERSVQSMAIDFFLQGVSELEAPVHRLWRDARRNLNVALELQPGWARLWRDCAEWARLSGNPSGRLRAARIAVLLDRTDPSALRDLAEAWIDRLPRGVPDAAARRETEDVLTVARRALELGSSRNHRVDLSALLCARLEKRLGRIEAARGFARQALGANPGYKAAEQFLAGLESRPE